MSKNKFLSVKFNTSVELGSAGYSVVGGPNRDGVYNSVPVAVAEGWYWEALLGDGAIEVLGEGSEPAEGTKAEASPAFNAALAESQGADAIAAATAVNAKNAKPLTEEQKAANAAVAKAAVASSKATSQAAAKTAPKAAAKAKK